MRDDRDILWPKPASAPEKGRGPHCGKDRRNAIVCPCRWGTHLARFSRESGPGGISLLPTWHGILAKAFQVSFPAFHLARNSCKSVSGVSSCHPPGTEFLRKCSRCPFLPPTCHGSSSHHGMLVFFSRACGCFQHEACNHQHTCSCGIHASF